MKANRVLQISEINGLFIGILYSDGGILWNTLPVKSIEDVYSKWEKSDYSYDIQSSTDNKGFAKIIYNLHSNPLSFWDTSLSIPIDLNNLNENHQKVLNSLRLVKPGETITYGELASRSGMPSAARFVGSCMRRNPTPLLIPCHRVLPASGKLGEYSAFGGASSKDRYLRLEGVSLKI